MDILQQAAYREAEWLNENVTGLTTSITNLLAYPTACIHPCLAHNTQLWAMVPELQGSNIQTFTLSCVSNNSGGTGDVSPCYQTSTWTVPTGAKIARFMIWGAGAGSGTPNCCGFAPSGATGAFASVIMSVTPGETYNISVGSSASGCQCNCGCQSWIQQGCYNGNKTFITGPGLTNFCAEGGDANIYEGMKARACSAGCTTYINNACCKFYPIRHGCATENSICCGGCICCSSWVCHFGYGAGPGCCVNAQGSYTRSAYGSSDRGVVWTIPSIYGGHYHDSNLYSAIIANIPYQPGATTASNFPYTWFPTTSTCHAWGIGIGVTSGNIACAGAGGFGATAFGGCTQAMGDRGRGGAACIQWIVV